jgi:tRNA(Ile)-lysidine synthase
VSELPSHVEQSIRARGLFVRGQRLLVAVSGGGDSMVLLQVLHELAPRHGWRLTIAHLNHALRGRSSDADERLVRRTAERLKLPIWVKRVDVRRFARLHRLSLEMAARKVRHEFLARAAAQREIPSIALAHQADDQLELFFLRLFRGSSGDGLAGMKWHSPSPGNREIELVRPLLDQPKSSLLKYAAETGIRFREDASNASMDIQRNRMRHELLPLLRTNYQPALSKIILRTTDILGAEAEFVARAASAWLGRRSRGKQARQRAGAQADLDRPTFLYASEAFEKLPVAVQRRVIQLQLLRQGVVADFFLVEELRSAADRPVTIGPLNQAIEGHGSFGGPSILTENFYGGIDSGEDPAMGGKPLLLAAIRDLAGLVHLQNTEPEAFRWGSMPLVLEGRAGEAQFAGVVIEWRISGQPAACRAHARKGQESFDADKIGSSILLRHWQPGDRFQPIGMTQPLKLQDFFTNEKVPPILRRRLILAANKDGEVFWVEGMRIAERFKLSKATIRRLQWRWERP